MSTPTAHAAPNSAARVRAIVAANLRAWAARRKVYISHLADRAGVGRTTLFKILKGDQNAQLDTLTALARELGIRTRDLLDEHVAPADAVRVTIDLPAQHHAWLSEVVSGCAAPQPDDVGDLLGDVVARLVDGLAQTDRAWRTAAYSILPQPAIGLYFGVEASPNRREPRGAR